MRRLDPLLEKNPRSFRGWRKSAARRTGAFRTYLKMTSRLSPAKVDSLAEQFARQAEGANGLHDLRGVLPGTTACGGRHGAGGNWPWPLGVSRQGVRGALLGTDEDGELRYRAAPPLPVP